MSQRYTTKFWEEGIEWNGVIYPAEIFEIKNFTRKFDVTDVIINMQDGLKNSFEDDVRCAIGPKVAKSKEEMGKAIT
jgi:hypothetical protein